MANTFSLIETITIASNQSSITFSNIPQTYTDLFCVTSLKNAQANYGGYAIQPNSQLNGWTKRGIRAAYTSSVQPVSGSNSYDGSYLPDYRSNGWGNDYFYIAGYTRTSLPKSYITHSGQQSYSQLNDWTILNNYLITTSETGAVTSLRLWLDTDSFQSGSTASLYGISNA